MRKKVCHLSYNHDSFDDRIYWKELLTLKEAGYEVIHICVANEEKDFISEEGVRIIQVKRIIGKQNIWLKRIGHFFTSNKTIDAILHQAREVGADIYHYHDLQLNAIVRKIKKFENRPKVVYDCHEAYHLILRQKSKNIISNYINYIQIKAVSLWELKCASSCNLIIATDNYTQKYFENKIAGVCIKSIYNYSFFLPTNIKKEKVYDFLYTGTINESRGIIEILYALNEVKEKVPNVQFLIIGTFTQQNYRQDVYDMIVRMQLENNVTIKPSVNFNQVKHYYEISKIGLGIFERKPQFENFIPIKLFEYMSNGLPVIFTNFGPSAEIIKKENCGILIDVKEDKSISKAMFKLLSEQKFFIQLSVNGKKAVSKEYNWEKEKQKLLNLYQFLS